MTTAVTYLDAVLRRALQMRTELAELEVNASDAVVHLMKIEQCAFVEFGPVDGNQTMEGLGDEVAARIGLRWRDWSKQCNDRRS
jgi:hypothetical protein